MVEMVKREYWINKIRSIWKKKSVIWLAGVRRSGKTTLCKSLGNIEYFDCEFPDVAAMAQDPRILLNRLKGKTVIFDEIHNLKNPSQLLKLAADYFPETKIIATGSSTLSATQKFKDSLTDRYIPLYLPPMLLFEGELFGNNDIAHRMLFGGLPPFFLKKELQDVDYHYWLEAFWAKDIQELFRLQQRGPFLKFVQLILAQSGGMFEATRLALECEVSRTTINNYLSILETTKIVEKIKPYTTKAQGEIKRTPKVYGFDTGFICYAKGWQELRQDDSGFLWEHIVLNEIRGHLQHVKINYWRDKSGHEIDFILQISRRKEPIAIECKWTSRTINPKNLLVFRKHAPKGKNYIVYANIDRPYEQSFDGLIVHFISLRDLIKELS